VTRARVRRAQQLLETTAHAVERVSELSGFAAPTTLRAQFQQIVGVSPKAYRRSFRGIRE
jgi:transcriptional regulator GlxA family with amidase domain